MIQPPRPPRPDLTANIKNVESTVENREETVNLVGEIAYRVLRHDAVGIRPHQSKWG